MPKGIVGIKEAGPKFDHLVEEYKLITRDIAILGLLYRRQSRNGGITPSERKQAFLEDSRG